MEINKNYESSIQFMSLLPLFLIIITADVPLLQNYDYNLFHCQSVIFIVPGESKVDKHRIVNIKVMIIGGDKG